MKQTLWDRNFNLLLSATTLGAIGGIAGSFALSFLVFDETGSTLASALTIAIRLIPSTLIPILVAPWMDRIPRKNFLVGGDVCNGIIYTLLGLWLLNFEFSYIGYLAVSLLLACVNAIDELAYNSIYPDVIPKGMEQKGYAVSSMLYPFIHVVMMPISAVLLETIGVPIILMFQGCMCLLAAFTESLLKMEKKHVLTNEKAGINGEEVLEKNRKRYTISRWQQDITEAITYLKEEKGLRSIYMYMGVTNGVANGYGPILVAFFRTAPRMTAAMYSFFSVVEFVGRTLGSAVQYHVSIPQNKKYSITFWIYQIYEACDMCLLWIPYPFMLLNRAVCGFLGSNSAILRSAAVQTYIPEHIRSRVQAFQGILITVCSGVFVLLVGFLGEFLDYRWCVTICGGISMIASWYFIGTRKKYVKEVYEREDKIS